MGATCKLGEVCCTGPNRSAPHEPFHPPRAEFAAHIAEQQAKPHAPTHADEHNACFEQTIAALKRGLGVEEVLAHFPKVRFGGGQWDRVLETLAQHFDGTEARTLRERGVVFCVVSLDHSNLRSALSSGHAGGCAA